MAALSPCEVGGGRSPHVTGAEEGSRPFPALALPFLMRGLGLGTFVGGIREQVTAAGPEGEGHT